MHNWKYLTKKRKQEKRNTLTQTNDMYLTNNRVYMLMKVSKLVRWRSDLIIYHVGWLSDG